MKIAIFKDITTEGVIKSIEENSEKYHVGFYADMNNAPERKLVKESAKDINDIIKQLDRARIDLSANYKKKIEKECKSIIDRLKVANAPFTILTDEYAKLRAKILFDEKEVVRLRAAMVQKEDDHEIGLLINKTFEFDKSEKLRAEAEVRHNLMVSAQFDAENRQIELNAKLKQDEINKENARLADVEHVRSVNNNIKSVLIDYAFNEEDSRLIVRLIAQGKLPHTTIKY